jgi:ABC-2 type transport system permease protein
VRRIGHIIKKEFLQLRRDRTMMLIIFNMPVLQLLILGYVVSADIKKIKTVICDLDNSAVSRAMVQQIHSGGYFSVVGYDRRESHLQGYLDRGEVDAAVVIPARFASGLENAKAAEIRILLNGQDINTATLALGYLSTIIQNFITEQIKPILARNGIDEALHWVTPNIRIWYNPDLKNSVFMVPGIIVFLLTLATSGLSAAALVREREIGTLEQLLVSPLKKHEIILGKLIPFAIIGLIELVIAVVFAKLWYQIPLVGNLILFLMFTVIYLFTSLGVGLLISASVHTQQQALFMSWFVMMFVLLMSGFMFPIENMPRFAQYLTWLNPMRYFMLVTREIFVKGADLRHLYEQGLALIVSGCLFFSVAVFKFQERLK